jgi:LuxR family maltose regulon positive regulatory protein
LTELLPGDCRLFCGSLTAGLLAEQNKLNDALNHAQSTLRSLNAIEETYHNPADEKETAVLANGETAANEIVFCVHLMLAEIYLAKGETGKYQAELRTLEEYMEKKKALYLMKNFHAYRLRAILWNGDKKAAQDWLTEYYVNDRAFGELYRIFQNFTTVRAYIVLGEVQKALSALQKIMNLALAMNRPLDAAEAGVLAAIAEWAMGKKKDAVSRLLSIIRLLQPFGFIRVIANEGKAVFPIINAVLRKLKKERDMDDALLCFIKEIRVAAYEQSKRFTGLAYGLEIKPFKMSQKQTYVLELLSKGHNNAELVEITGLSLNTIKTHLKIAYRKLEVSNAMDAIVEGKRRGIIV